MDERLPIFARPPVDKRKAQIPTLLESEKRRKADFDAWIQQTGKEFKARRMQVKRRRTENWVVHNANYATIQWRRSGKRYLRRIPRSRRHGELRVGSHRKERKGSS